jgi:FkbM family methyltransferase
MKKSLLPLAARFFSAPILRAIPQKMESLGAALQSKKGGGFDAEWQEVENASHFIGLTNPIIFDVGANSGAWTKRIREKIGKSVGPPKIVMFEPQPKCWPSLEIIQDDSVSLVKAALGEIAGTIDLYQSDNSEVASVYERSDFELDNVIKVEVTTIDDIISTHRFAYVDYIKMDIEGHELSAARGARQSLQQKRIGAISFEFGSANVNSRTFFLDLFKYFNSFGYVIYRMGHDGIPIHVPHYSRDLEYFAGVSNYIASCVNPKRTRQA